MIDKSLVVKYIDDMGMTTYLTLPYGIIFDFVCENDPLSIEVYVGNPADKKVGFLITTRVYIEPFNPFGQIFLEKTENDFMIKAEECAQEQFSLKVEEVLRSKDRIFDLTTFLEELSEVLNDCADTYIEDNYKIIPDEICDKMAAWEGKGPSSKDSDDSSTNQSEPESNPTNETL